MGAELKVGDRLPDELLKRMPGAGRTRVLYFMRAAWCPVCVHHLRRLADAITRLESLQASVVAFVPEAGETVALGGGRPLPFPVVSGPEAYGQLGLRRVLLGTVQQSGTVVVDGQGRVVLLRRAAVPFNAFDEQELFAALGSGVALGAG